MSHVPKSKAKKPSPQAKANAEYRKKLKAVSRANPGASFSKRVAAAKSGKTKVVDGRSTKSAAHRKAISEGLKAFHAGKRKKSAGKKDPKLKKVGPNKNSKKPVVVKTERKKTGPGKGIETKTFSDGTVEKKPTKVKGVRSKESYIKDGYHPKVAERFSKAKSAAELLEMMAKSKDGRSSAIRSYNSYAASRKRK